MSLLGIDVGATGCKAATFSLDGLPLARAYQDYKEIVRPGGIRELDSRQVWAAVQQVIRRVASRTKRDPIQALSVASMGEAMVPIATDGSILGHCLLGFDQPRSRYVRQVEGALGARRLFDITGNVPSASFSLTNLCWLRDNRPDLFDRTWRFVLWTGLVCSLLGGSSVCDYSLANRTLLFDIAQERWSSELLTASGLPESKLPELATAGTPAGTVSPAAAKELELPPSVNMILGGHDQCCSALGAGIIRPGMALYGLGAYICITPTFQAIPLTSMLQGRGLNMEHHVVPGLFVSFLYNLSGGAVLRWFRDSLAPLERREAQKRGVNIYDELLSEMPDQPTDLMVLPHFATTGPPHFDRRSSGVIMGLNLRTTRGEIIKALLEGMTYYFAEGRGLFEEVGIRVEAYRGTGGGARSERWLQLTADILGQPIERPQIIDAGPLGAAILAGVGSGLYASYEEAVNRVVRIQRRFEPDQKRHSHYQARLARYRELYPLLRDYLHRLHDAGQP